MLTAFRVIALIVMAMSAQSVLADDKGKRFDAIALFALTCVVFIVSMTF